MKIPAIIGVFFLVLAAVFGLATLRSFLVTQGQGLPANKSWTRIAIIFALVGAGLVLWQLIFP